MFRSARARYPYGELLNGVSEFMRQNLTLFMAWRGTSQLWHGGEQVSCDLVRLAIVKSTKYHAKQKTFIKFDMLCKIKRSCMREHFPPCRRKASRGLK